MRYDDERDIVIIEDENGQEKEYAVEALFDMEDQLYALLRGENDETLLFRVEDEGDEQYVVGITDPNIKESILDAYQIAVKAAPAE
ncbi:MAG TPA: DUF1292 domain-containing protein [Bacillus sp. (in: firmicutes)]|uniref:DUF1292 domain-containing protein n=1 Tax=Bacillus litorisediminis TaxID=2922713 RepID=UPI001FAFA2EE|nr:DUF1292 domain-containing protein [Bacillus litorisediminis]HWO76721.1 DUF1292 domain-containing protein [Bacillus sp. (in: firmicutes)]